MTITTTTTALSCLLLVLNAATPVSSLGSLFGRPSLERRDSLEATPLVEITKSVTILGIQNDETTRSAVDRPQQATVQVKLEYTQCPEGVSVDDFGWVLPLPSRPTRVHLGSALLFEGLQSQTSQQHAKLDYRNYTSTTEATSLATIVDGNANWTYCNANMLQATCGRATPVEVEATDSASTVSPIANNNPSPAEEPVNVNVAGYFQYVILDSGEAVLEWLESKDYVLPSFTSTTSNNSTLTAAEQWNELLNTYTEQGGVFMALQLAHLPNATFGSSQPIMIEYPVVPTTTTTEGDTANGEPLPAVHRLPLTMSQKTAAPDATFEVFVLSDYQKDEETTAILPGTLLDARSGTGFTSIERALPVNYLDLTLDDAFIDWMGCESDFMEEQDNNNNGDEKRRNQCFEMDYQDRLFQATYELGHRQCLITEYAGPLEDVYTDLQVPEGLVIALAASSMWLSFLAQLQEYGIPPIPIVLEILDKYLPPSSFKVPTTSSNSSSNEALVSTRLGLVQACLELNHVYEAPQVINRDGNAATDPTMPTLQNCFELYTPPSDGWVFDSRACVSELENRVFQPYRRSQAWMQSFTSLTRVTGRLDATENIDDEAVGEGDPYFVLAADKPPTDTRHHAASVAPVCDAGTPLALEFVPNNDTSLKFWQPAKYDCPRTWEQTLDTPVFGNLEGNLSLSSNRSVAVMVQAWGVGDDSGVTLVRDELTGQFAMTAVEMAVDYGLEWLKELLEARSQQVLAIQKEQEEAKDEGSDNNMDSGIIGQGNINNGGGEASPGGNPDLDSSFTSSVSSPRQQLFVTFSLGGLLFLGMELLQ